MATSLLTKPAAKGGSFLLDSAAPADIFTPADLTDDQKLIGQTAEEFVIKEVLPLAKDLENKKPGLMAELVRKAAELGLMSGGTPEEYGGAGLDKIATTVLTEKISIYGGFRGDARSARRNRHAADRLFRNGRAEEKIPAQAGERRIDRRVLPFGTASRKRRAEFADARGTEQGRHALHPERAEDVDHQRGIRGSVRGVRQGGWRKVHRVHRGAEIPRLQTRQRRTQDGDSRQLDDADFPGKLHGAEGKRAARNRPRAHRRVQRAERGAVYAGRFGRWRDRSTC